MSGKYKSRAVAGCKFATAGLMKARFNSLFGFLLLLIGVFISCNEYQSNQNLLIDKLYGLYTISSDNKQQSKLEDLDDIIVFFSNTGDQYGNHVFLPKEAEKFMELLDELKIKDYWFLMSIEGVLNIRFEATNKRFDGTWSLTNIEMTKELTGSSFVKSFTLTNNLNDRFNFKRSNKEINW